MVAPLERPAAEPVRVPDRASARASTAAAQARDAATVAANAAPSEATALAEIGKARHARLAYVREERRTVVEVLNPRTGDVIYRFPPESIEQHRTDLGEARPGTVVDRSV